MKPISQIQPATGGHYEPPKPAPPKGQAHTRRFCQDQLSRLSGKFGAPRGEADEFRLKTVIDALMFCEDEAHVIRVIDRLEESERYPDGYAIRQMAYETRTRERRPDPKCGKCNGLGVVVKQKDGIAYGGRCGCDREVGV